MSDLIDRAALRAAVEAERGMPLYGRRTALALIDAAPRAATEPHCDFDCDACRATDDEGCPNCRHAHAEHTGRSLRNGRLEPAEARMGRACEHRDDAHHTCSCPEYQWAAPRAATEPLHEGRWFVHRDLDAATDPPLPSALDIAVALQGVDPADLRLGHDLRKPAAVILANLKRAVAHKALTSSIPVIYLAHPLGGDWEGNIASARVYAERAVRILGVCPVAPYLTLYGLLHEPADRLIGIGLDAAIIPKCDELWLCGPRVSPGMELERDQALKLGIPVRRWTAPDAELRDL